MYYTAAEALSRGVIASYDVTVTASDGKGGQSSAVLTVEVTPNTPPTSSCVGSGNYVCLFICLFVSIPQLQIKLYPILCEKVALYNLFPTHL